MTHYQKLVLRGLWILIKLTLKVNNFIGGTQEVLWMEEVEKKLKPPEDNQ